MQRFRKKPVVVTAKQFWKGGDHPAVVRTGLTSTGYGIETLEGFHVVTPGDWIICGVHGEFYACKPDIFEKTYEPAD